MSLAIMLNKSPRSDSKILFRTKHSIDMCENPKDQEHLEQHLRGKWKQAQD
jgi:hypothetical protein